MSSRILPRRRHGSSAHSVEMELQSTRLLQEVTSEAGHATYFFRLLEPASFAALKGEDLAVAVSKSLMRLNRGLATLNFRRQPIYLSEDAIQQGAFAMYRVALRRLDSLQWIRQAFLGRAIHNDSWEKQATAIVGAPAKLFYLSAVAPRPILGIRSG